MKAKASKFAVVDLFAGPGGLAEGFSAVATSEGHRPFHIALSVEKDRAAHSTLLLRSFLRQFGGVFPPEYYAFLRNQTVEPDWERLYPEQWKAACAEALHLELGLPDTEAILNTRIDALRASHGSQTILIGGPPCQAYSLVGRARNRGIKTYQAESDPRHRLYEQYIRILNRLRPAVFVMENVKGMLSSSLDKGLVFDLILRDLHAAGGHGGYHLLALTPKDAKQSELLPRRLKPSDFIVRGEDLGLPQARHRVIIIGVHRDSLRQADDRISMSLPSDRIYPPSRVKDVLEGMPKLRSGLSRNDSPSATHPLPANHLAPRLHVSPQAS